jgi:hypothetical protein
MPPVVRVGDMAMGVYKCKTKPATAVGVVSIGTAMSLDDAMGTGKMGVTMVMNIACPKCPISIAVAGSPLATAEGAGITRIGDIIVGITGGVGTYINSSPDTMSG